MKVAVPPPPPSIAEKSPDPPPLEPAMSMTSSTPSMSRRASSTSRAPSETVSRSDPAGKVWVTMIMFCPVLPRKSTFNSGTRDTVMTSSSTEEMMVMIGCFCVPRRIGL